MTFSDPSSALLSLLHLALVALSGVALVDCLRQSAPAFPAAGKLTKPAWLGILGVALLFSLLELASALNLLGVVVAVACIVYLVDVKPAVSGMRPGRGPYG